MNTTKHIRSFALILVLPAALVLSACSSSASGNSSTETSKPAATAGRDLAVEEANRTLVLDFYDRFFNEHETEEAAKVVAEDYVQHNPQVPDGKEPFVSYFTEFFQENPDAKAEIVRSATDGDLVYLHVRSTDGPDVPSTAVVDIFRVEDGQIVEHWDVLQEVPAESANSNTMF